MGVSDLSLLATAALDQGAWGLPCLFSFICGGLLAAASTGVFVWGARTMRSTETMGVTVDLYTDAPYAYTRNPQYVGMVIGIVGFAPVANSLLVASLATAHVGRMLLLPRAEEPHLRVEFGRRTTGTNRESRGPSGWRRCGGYSGTTAEDLFRIGRRTSGRYRI